MPNSHNSGYFPGGTGLVNATGDLITVSPASALVGTTLTLPSGGTGGSTAIATATTVGTVKPGNNLSIRSDGTLDAATGASSSVTGFSIEAWGGDGTGGNPSGSGLNTRYAISQHVTAAGYSWSAFATHPVTQQDDYCWNATNNSPTSGNTWNLASQYTTTSNGFASPGVCNEDKSYFYVQINNPNNLAGYFHKGMPITGGGLAGGSTVISTQGQYLRISPQANGFGMNSGTVLTVCPDMSKFSAGKQLFSPQGLQPLLNITNVNGTTITLGSQTVMGNANSPNSTTNGVSNAFTGNGVPMQQQLIVYTPAAENGIGGSVSNDHVAIAMADAYTATAGNRVMTLGAKNYQITPGIISAGGALSLQGLGALSTNIFSNGSVQGSGGASVFKMYPRSTAKIFHSGLNFSYYTGRYRTILDYDGNGFMSIGIYDPNNNPNGYAQNQVNTACVNVDQCSGSTNYSGSSGALEMTRFEGCNYCRWNYNTWQGDNTTGCRGLNFGRAINIEILSSLIFYCDVAVEQTDYCEHPIFDKMLLQSCGMAFTNRLSSQFGFSSMFYGEFRGGDLACSTTNYDIRDANQISITDFNARMAASNLPALRLSGCLVVVVNGGYALGTGNGTAAAIQIGSSMRQGGVTGTDAVRVHGFGSDNFTSAITLDAGQGRLLYSGISNNNSASGAVVDNSGSATKL